MSVSTSKSKVSFDIQIKTVEVKNYKTKELENKEYVEIEVSKGATKWSILNFGEDSTFDVYRTVNGKRSAIASRIGKPFHSWLELCEHYKSITTELKEHFIDVQIYQSLILKTNK
jgi:hypothetical protein